MMKVLMVFESMWGNTERVARAIAEGLSKHAAVEVVEVHDAPMKPEGFDAIVVGGPTHAFGMARRSTRADAMRQMHRAESEAATGLDEWLEMIPPAAAGVKASAFSTRIEVRFLPSRHAATVIGKRLRKLGYELAAKPEAFLVDGTEGPVTDGELDRARRWGEDLGGRLAVKPAA